MQVINRTPFRSSVFIDTDRNGAQVLALAVKATYDMVGDVPVLAREQKELAFADIFSGEPGASSLLYESDANWGRTGTDVAVAGYAYPAREGDCEAEVMLRVGSLSKRAHVFGNRSWTTRFGLAQLTLSLIHI